MTLPKTLAVLTISSLALSIAPAMAGLSDVHIQTKEVSVLGYDLSERADAENILNKIEAAAEKVCTVSAIRQTVRERVLRQRCADKATDMAVRSLNSPTLTAVFSDSLAR